MILLFFFFYSFYIAIMVRSYQEWKITMMLTILASIKRSVYYKCILQFCRLLLVTLEFLKKDGFWLTVSVFSIHQLEKMFPTLSFIGAVIVSFDVDLATLWKLVSTIGVIYKKTHTKKGIVTFFFSELRDMNWKKSALQDNLHFWE